MKNKILCTLAMLIGFSQPSWADYEIDDSFLYACQWCGAGQNNPHYDLVANDCIHFVSQILQNGCMGVCDGYWCNELADPTSFTQPVSCGGDNGRPLCRSSSANFYKTLRSCHMHGVPFFTNSPYWNHEGPFTKADYLTASPEHGGTGPVHRHHIGDVVLYTHSGSCSGHTVWVAQDEPPWQGPPYIYQWLMCDVAAHNNRYCPDYEACHSIWPDTPTGRPTLKLKYLIQSESNDIQVYLIYPSGTTPDQATPDQPQGRWTPEHGLYNVVQTLHVASGTQLSMAPGVQVQFANGTGITVDEGGVLSLEGTADNPIILHSTNANQLWSGLVVNSSFPDNSLGSLSIQNGDIILSNQSVINIEPGSSLQFSPNSQFLVNDQASLKINGTPDNPVTMRCTDPNSTWGGLHINSNNPLDFNNIGSLNIYQADIVLGTASYVNVSSGSVLKFSPGHKLIIDGPAQSVHVFNALGTPEQPILFTTTNGADPSQNWGGIRVKNTIHGDMAMSNCVIENATIGIRAYPTSNPRIMSTTIRNCGIGIVVIDDPAGVDLSFVNITDCRYYGIVSIGTSLLLSYGCNISNCGRAGLWTSSMSNTILRNSNFSQNGPSNQTDRDLIHGGIRNSFGSIQMGCVNSSNNRGVGLCSFGGFIDMAPASGTVYAIGKNTIENNLPIDGTQTQIYFCNTVPDLCNGRNKISDLSSTSIRIEDCGPTETDVTNNYWGTNNLTGLIPSTYSNAGNDVNNTNRCGLGSLPVCSSDEASYWYDQAWSQENLMLYEEAIMGYKHVIQHYPTSKVAKLCPDRIVFCEAFSEKDWQTQRNYFLEVADTTTSLELKISSRASAAWCLVEMDEMTEATDEFIDLMNQSNNQYQYQKVALLSLLAELKNTPWDSLEGIRNNGGSIDEELQSDPVLSIANRMEKILNGSHDSIPSTVIPSEYALYQNYPNPFNPATQIVYDLKEAGMVSIKVYNILGQEVASLVNTPQNIGKHTVQFDGSTLSSGIYIYRLEVNNFTAQNKMILLK